MGAPLPALNTVITAVISEISALIPASIPANSEVIDRRHRLTDDVEELFIRRAAQGNADGSLDVFYVGIGPRTGQDGPAPGERYSFYNIVVEHWNTRKQDSDWLKKAADVGEAVIAKIENNSAVFAIGGQRQLRTPQIVDDDGQYEDTTTLDSASGNFDTQTIVQAFLRFTVEARRWT